MSWSPMGGRVEELDSLLLRGGEPLTQSSGREPWSAIGEGGTEGGGGANVTLSTFW